MFQKMISCYKEYPKHFWVLMGSSFIDRMGGALLFPFFALYVTQKFSVGMAEVGVLFAIFAISSQIGSVLGGALADKFGRKSMIIFGLVVSAVSSIAMGLVEEIRYFYFLAAIVGVLADIGQPAQQAMVADLLPEEQHAEGYGIWRVIANVAVMFGPIIGGFMADRSYFLLFITDAITSIITALMVHYLLPETKPEISEDKDEESLLESFKGYGKVLKDRAFSAFIVISIVLNIVYIQLNSTLPVFMRDVKFMPTQNYGYILSLNAAMVVFFQFWVTRKLKKTPPMLVMALGAIFYLVGFGMFGFVSGIWFFTLAMVILTIGELVVIPVASALVAKFAPAEMRGRYMATFSLSWTIPFAVGPYMAGLLMDNYDPNWVWYGCIILGVISFFGFLLMHWIMKGRFSSISSEENPIST